MWPHTRNAIADCVVEAKTAVMCVVNSLSLGASFTLNQLSVGRLQVKLSASVVMTTKSPVRPEQNAG